MKVLDVVVSGICGALYAAVGYIIYLFLPITTPGVGIVRFWPNVVIPAALFRKKQPVLKFLKGQI